MKIFLTGYTDKYFGGSTSYFLKLASLKNKKISYFISRHFIDIKGMKKTECSEMSSKIFNINLPLLTGNHFVKPFLMLNSYFTKIDVPDSIDLVHVYDRIALTNKPNIHFFDNTPFDSVRIWGLSEKHKLSSFCVDYFAKKYLKILNHPNCKKVVFFSKQARDSFIHDTGFDKSRTDIIPVPVCIKKLPKKKRNDKPIVLLIGRQLKRKGADILLQAFSYVQNESELILVGDPDNEIKYLSEKLKNVTILNNVSDEKINNLYQKADIYCLPSRGEGTPLSILDAMNYSLPVISTNVWGIPSEVIDKKTGYLIEKDNVDQLKNNLNILIRDDKKRIRMGKEGRKHLIKNFSEKIVEKKLDKVYEEALK